MRQVRQNINIKIFIYFFPLILISQEFELKEIQLSGLINDKDQEISGMDWYKNKLFLLPENQNGFLFVLEKNEIINAINADDGKIIRPQKTRFIAPDYSELIQGFDGFEAISFKKKNVYISIEAEHDGVMMGYLIWGKINSRSNEIKIPETNIKQIETPIQLKNISFESLLHYKKDVLMMYEANGFNLQPEGASHILFSSKNKVIKELLCSNVEYRITDVTKLDGKNRFWAINYFWPGDKKLLKPSRDIILEKTKEGKTHKESDVVERLIEFEIKDNNIVFTDKEPMQLELEKNNPRNWEAIARLEDKGLLIATDKHPRMIFGFISFK